MKENETSTRREGVDISKPGREDKKKMMDSLLKDVEVEHEQLLHKVRSRYDRVGIELPKIEVRFEHLSVKGEAYVGKRALPTLLNSALNAFEAVFGIVGVLPSKKRTIKILHDLNGIIKPSRFTLLLGPPGSGKTTLLNALSGKLDRDLEVEGKVTYCGHEFPEFVPQRTSANVSNHDLHQAELTVRETLDFSAECLGVGCRSQLMGELLRREKEAGIDPDPEIDAFMKAITTSNNKTSVMPDYVIKILGLDICADIIVGDEMRRGISGGEKKRLTTGEMIVGPARAFFMDHISTGLDSATTYQIIKFLNQMVHIMDMTMVVSLLQPAPETFNLFDDIILLSEGAIVYQGPRDNILEFFEYSGFKCPERKGVADFLQEVTSRKDQEQYWFKKDQPYQYVSVHDFVEAFNSFSIGQQLTENLKVPIDKSSVHPSALLREKYGTSNRKLFKACFSREWLLMKRNSFVHIFKCIQITIMAIFAVSVFPRTEMKAGGIQDAAKYWGILFFSLMTVMFNGMAELTIMGLRLPIFYKQRDSLFFPAWAFALPTWLLSIPISFIESGIWMVLTYYSIGFAPAASRFFKQFLAFFSLHQMALSLFRFIVAVGRTQVIGSTLGIFTFLLTLVLGGFVVAKDDMEPWMKWCSYFSPLMYVQNAISINEFLDHRWSNLTGNPTAPTVGKLLLNDRGLYTDEYWYWICIAALLGFSLLFNVAFIIALTFLNPFGESKSIASDEDLNNNTIQELAPTSKGNSNSKQLHKGMILPFQPLSLTFNHVNYYVDMPLEMKKHGAQSSRLQLLKDVSGAFKPGVLTALVGVTGAGKTTLMDVLAGRKTSGYADGSISISGYPKNQSTFARISGYCEQIDIHSPYVTVYESLVFSAWLRLAADIKKETRELFVEEVMELIELNPLRNALVGVAGVDGLSIEQRKRLTIAVELVANPSIIFMDEPTTGLDARAAAIVMRTVRNTVDTGRTVVCTIHQPSIDIFESFDELLLIKKGGKLLYAGALGHHSQNLINYFEAIPGIPRIKGDLNPATWMLEITSASTEAQLGVDFAEIYANSDLYRKNQELIEELSTPQPNTKDLYFPTQYSRNFIAQCKACFWKQHCSYWRNSQYNGIRLFITTVIGILFGLVFWNKGHGIKKQQDLLNLLGAVYAAVLFLGATNAANVQSIVHMERTVFYRERAAGMYSEFPYAFGQVVIELIYVAIQAFIYAILLYSMMGFHWKVENFFYFYYFIFTCFAYFTLYGMMALSLTPGPQIAAIVMAFFANIWNLFSGFIVPKPLLPIWWRWYYWANPVAWTIYGIITSQVGDKKDVIQVPGSQPMPLNTFLKEYLDFDHDFLLVVVAANFGWILLFFLCFAFGIKLLNYQKR